MPNFTPLTLSLPAHWLAPILYGDTSGLDDAEDRAFGRWLMDHMREFGPGHIGKIHSAPYFARYHDAAEYGVLACSCYDVEFMIEQAQDTEAA